MLSEDDNLTLDVPEMPTSGDLKSGDFLLPSRNFNDPSPQWEWLKTLYDVLHDVHTIKIRMLEIIFVNDKIAPETVLRIRKIQVLSWKWAKSQTKSVLFFITWDQAQFERFSYILSNSYR